MARDSSISYDFTNPTRGDLFPTEAPRTEDIIRRVLEKRQSPVYDVTNQVEDRLEAEKMRLLRQKRELAMQRLREKMIAVEPEEPQNFMLAEMDLTTPSYELDPMQVDLAPTNYALSPLNIPLEDSQPSYVSGRMTSRRRR